MPHPSVGLTTKLKRVKDGLHNLNPSMGNVQASVHEAKHNFLRYQEAIPSIPSTALLTREEILCGKDREALLKEEIFL